MEFNLRYSRLPFVLLTNGGGRLEKDKAMQLNELFGFQEYSYEYFIEKDVLLNFSPLRPIMKEYEEKPVLIIGSQDIERIAQSCGLKQYITLDEFCSLYPHLV